MEESGSEGLDDLINAEAGPGKFFEGVDCVCISDNYWLNDVTVSLRSPTMTDCRITRPPLALFDLWARKLEQHHYSRSNDLGYAYSGASRTSKSTSKAQQKICTLASLETASTR